MSGDLADGYVRTVVSDDLGLWSNRRPDYGSGPYLRLCCAVVRLARRDLCDARFSAEAREFLDESDLVDVFAECLEFGGTF